VKSGKYQNIEHIIYISTISQSFR